MYDWISWLTQHPLGRLSLALSTIWFCLGWWRWWRCRQQLAYLDLPLWLPALLGLLSPFLVFRGLAAGWQRLDRELVGLSTLEPWEGLRALEIVRHASHSFGDWSAPLVSAGLTAFGCAVVLTAWHSLWRFHLYLYRRARRRPPTELQEIRQELKQLRQLLEDLNARLASPA